LSAVAAAQTESCDEEAQGGDATHTDSV